MWLAFGLTWLAYASYYLTRKNFSVAKHSIELDLGVDRSALGMIDTGYLFAYAMGQFFWGFAADKVGARRVIALGMLLTAACSIGFGLSSTFAMFALLFSLNGLVQSSGWPANLKAMTTWFPRRGRGAVMGIWSTCYQIGSLVANPIAGFFLAVSVLGWRMAFFGPAIWVAAVGVLIFFLLPEKKAPVDEASKAAFTEEVVRERGRVLRTPLVWGLGASYFFMKLNRYILLFWLPYYMAETLHYSKALAATIPLSFEAGGLLGSISIGYVSDRWFGSRRLGVSLLFLVLLAGAMPLYAALAHRGVMANIIALAIVGFCLFGPDTLVSATAAQDVGGPAAAATAGGLINGTGSLGPIIGSAFAASISLRFGWAALFSMLGVGALLSALALLPFYLRERASASAPKLPESVT
jgi:sugar phosphate permease